MQKKASVKAKLIKECFWILFDGGGNADPAWGFAPMAGELRIGADFF